MRGKTSIPARCVESNWKERELISVEMVNLSPLEGITRLTGRQVTWKLDYTRIELCLIAHTRPPRTLEWSRRNPEGIQVSRSVLWITRLYITWVTCNIVVNVTRIYNNRVTFEVTRLWRIELHVIAFELIQEQSRRNPSVQKCVVNTSIVY